MPSIERCRSCGQADLRSVLDLGLSPIADRLLEAGHLDEPEPRFPLELVFCPACGLVQLRETLAPEDLFGPTYAYFSAISEDARLHAERLVESLVQTRALGPHSLVIEPGSNDGYLLSRYQARGVPVLGIEPAPQPAAAAQALGVPTHQGFLTQALAKALRDGAAGLPGRPADLIHVHQVLSQATDTNDFVAALATLLAPDGVIVIEEPYVKDLIDQGEFDTVYHERLCYFSLTALDRLLRRYGLYANEVRRTPLHGGSIQVIVEPTENVVGSVTALLGLERASGLDRLEAFEGLGERAARIKSELLGLLRRLKSEGKRIAAYGASAKGCTLVNTLDLGPELIDYVVDQNPHKHGRYMPGQRLPICATERLLEDAPDYVLLLSWNLAQEIADQQSEYRRRGGHFIIPAPEPQFI